MSLTNTKIELTRDKENCMKLICNSSLHIIDIYFFK